MVFRQNNLHRIGKKRKPSATDLTPHHPRCGMASPDASQGFGMAMRTSPKGARGQRDPDSKGGF
jgi:hypothetical protein